MLIAIPMLSPLLYQVQKWEIRNFMSRLLQEKKLQVISVPAKDVVWMDKHEIWVNEQMFDIVSATLEDGIYQFTGLYDAAETAVVQKQINTGEEDGQDKKRIGHMIKWLQATCLLQEADAAVAVAYIPTRYPGYNSSLNRAFPEVMAPPPRSTCYPTT